MWLLFLLLAANRPEIPNPNIDMPGYLYVAHEAAEYRVARRVTEEEFLRLSGEPAAVIVDGGSSERSGERQVKGAVNLTSSHTTAASLRAAIPDPSAPVL